jgi:hypothetical protein
MIDVSASCDFTQDMPLLVVFKTNAALFLLQFVKIVVFTGEQESLGLLTDDFIPF